MENLDSGVIKNELDEMNTAFGDRPMEQDKELDKEQQTEDNEDQPDDDQLDDQPDEEQETDKQGEQSTDAPTTEPPPEEKDKDKIIAELRAKIDELSTKQPKNENEQEQTTQEKQEPLTFQEQDFIGESDVDDLISDPKEFNKLLNDLYKKTISDARQLVGEAVLRSIPDIVRANVTIINDLQKASDEFYSTNEDLKPFKKVVATVFEEVASENPGKPFNEIFPKVADEARKRLELYKKTVQPTNKPPKLPTRKNRIATKAKPNTDPLLSELEEMNKALRR